MTTYTKRQYNADLAANAETAASIALALENLTKALENGETVNYGDFDSLHDREWDNEQERRAIECRWSRRKWTGADYASWELIVANVD